MHIVWTTQQVCSKRRTVNDHIILFYEVIRYPINIQHIGRDFYNYECIIIQLSTLHSKPYFCDPI